jgi:hypothetical protein
VTRVDLATGRTVATITVRRAPWTSRRPRGRLGDQLRQRRRQRGADRPGDQPGRLRRGCGLDGQLARQLRVPDRPRDEPGRWSPIPIGFRAGNLVVGTGGVWVTSDDRVDAAPRRTWWLCASTRRPTERSRRSPSVVTRSMSRQPRAPSGCRSQTPARRYGLPGANAASRPGCVSLSGSHDELGGTDGRLGVGGLQARKASRLQPIWGYERNVWPPRTRPRRSINRAKRTTSAAAPFP